MNTTEILDGREPDADGYIRVTIPDIMIGLIRSAHGEDNERILTKKVYKKTIIFDDAPPKLNIELEPLNLTDDKQNKRRNIDGAGVHGEDIRDRTSERDLGMCR